MKLHAAEQKIAKTDTAARQIMSAELVAREKKTARLKVLRLQKEEAARVEEANNPAPVKRAPRKKALPKTA
ncbi:hypothetical protein G6N74_19025 [Mesorhizobium sp. CGMCC 1.15528]|jgi:hypothetical protein|uniref:Uncharacterized protein n=1 Tax=Mesorhizobium zhangyense TaxID=1776730 RepID=A0A7C9VDG0_9HYPH|nr:MULTISPECIES: hypothetical protein [Mesorhizobium]NGN43167.1 hypothetical protein [Mesorhizobium zhangyense]RJG46933.1 hypothetical protein D3Y55_23645 [Mesorhizobium sp. DCY119]SFU12666.1 hypothetical protein SAMN05518861_11442 [Mesorhizobium sp. YR577]